jgi:ribonuclease VapC
MMAVDTSAIIAIMGRESGYEKFLDILDVAKNVAVSTAIVLEATQIASRWGDAAAIAGVDDTLVAFGAKIWAVDATQIQIARQAFLRYGKGRGHPAQLNQMDCFSYALARALDAPLLFKGQDFLHTDVRQALA